MNKGVRLKNSSGITLYGAGGHCKVVMDILESMGQHVDLIVDDSPEDQLFMGTKCTKPTDTYHKVIVTIGNCKIRKAIAERISATEFPTAIHPSAIISPHSTVGKGTVVMQGVIAQSCAEIGNHCILNTKSSVGHDVKIHDYVHVASGATICRGSEIGECTWIGAGTVVKQGIRSGKNCMIGAGSVVVKDIPDNVVAYGNPCRTIRENV